MAKGIRPQIKSTLAVKPKTVVKSTPRKPTPISDPPTKAKKETYPANRFPMTKRKVTLTTTKASKKIPPPTGWSVDCWNLFQEKRSKLKKDEYLDVKAYFYYDNWLKTRVINERFRICCSEVDRPVMEEVVAWLKKHEK